MKESNSKPFLVRPKTDYKLALMGLKIQYPDKEINIIKPCK
jgi:hypothetical protein